MSPDPLPRKPSLGSPVEQAILAAGDIVRPSHDLRPQVLEAGRKHLGKQLGQRAAGGVAFAFGLLVLIGMPLTKMAAEHFESIQTPSSTEIQRRAAIYALQREIGTNWGLTEAFGLVKQSQAERFGQLQATARE